MAGVMCLGDLERSMVLGSGTYGTVYKAVHRKTGIGYALKKYTTASKDTGMPFDLIREASSLAALHDCPNVITKRTVLCEPGPTYYMVMDYCANGTLSELIKRTPGGLQADLVRAYMRQLLVGLAACHDRSIIHRDVKPQNILISDDNVLKLCDFGGARTVYVPRPLTPDVCTLWYRAPEVIMARGRYGSAMDIWSAACIFAEMTTGSVMVPGESDMDQLHRSFRVAGTPTADTWPEITTMRHYSAKGPQFLRDTRPYAPTDPEGRALFDSMLVCNPAHRPAATTLLTDAYFAPLC